MTTEETTKFITALDVMYPNAYKDFDIYKKRMLVQMWANSLRDYNYKICFDALQMYVNSETSGFIPTPAHIISNIQKMAPEQDMSANDAYAKVYKAISNSGYHAQEEYNKLPEEIKKVVSLERLMQLAKDDKSNLITFEATFKKEYAQAIKDKKQFEALPLKNQENILRLKNMTQDLFNNNILGNSKEQLALKTDGRDE